MMDPSLKFQRYTKCKTLKKWQLFYATDFQSLMHPCFTFCRMIGIFPYRINTSTFETSTQRYILMTVIICVFCIYELITLYEIDIIGERQEIPKILERNCFYILGGFIVIVMYILSNSRMHLLQTIMDISSKLSPDSYRKLSKLIHTKDIFGFFFLVGQWPLYIFFINSNYFRPILEIYIILVIFQMDMLYMNCVCILKACFKDVNDNLMNLRKLMVNDEPHLLRRIYHEQKNSFLLMELKALKKQHLMISDTVQTLNTIFSLHLLATIIYIFAEITFHLYSFILQWESSTLMNNTEKAFDVLLVTSLMYNCIKIALIAWACDTGKDEAMRIGITVHKILNSTIDKQIKDELQMFSLQILHRENTFSAKGLTIDATLLVAIVGHITTYLLILIQDLVANQVCNKMVINRVTL